MKVDLPSGEWIEVRDKLKAADLFRTQAAMRVTVNADESVDADAGIMALATTTLLARITTAWSYGQLPGEHSCPECTGSRSLWHQHVNDYVGDTIDLADWPAVQRVMQPMMDQVMEAMKGPEAGTSSG